MRPASRVGGRGHVHGTVGGGDPFKFIIHSAKGGWDLIPQTGRHSTSLSLWHVQQQGALDAALPVPKRVNWSPDGSDAGPTAVVEAKRPSLGSSRGCSVGAVGCGGKHLWRTGEGRTFLWEHLPYFGSVVGKRVEGGIPTDPPTAALASEGPRKILHRPNTPNQKLLELSPEVDRKKGSLLLYAIFCLPGGRALVFE